MISVLKKLGSTRLALLGMGLLAVGAALSYDNPVDTPTWVLVAPLAFLACNLLAAIITNPLINRRTGLLVFHLGLLGVVLLVGVGRLTYMEANLEILSGNNFDARDLISVRQGPLHAGELDKVQFVQGRYTVDYSPGMRRGLTHSTIQRPDGNGGWIEQDVGDDRPLLVEGYRFYTTFNKGFAPILSWHPDQGNMIMGTVHMPSYPLFDFRQSNTWTPPNGNEIKFWLRLDTGIDEKAAWTLDVDNASAVLIVNSANGRHELQEGEQVRLNGGVLKYEQLSSWMGYKLFYDPTLLGLFIVVVIGVLGLSVHFWNKLKAATVVSDKKMATSSDDSVEVKSMPSSLSHSRLV